MRRAMIAAAGMLALLAGAAGEAGAQGRTVYVCGLGDDDLVSVPVQYDPAVGDTTVSGPPPGLPYAAGQTWYINNDDISFRGRSFAKTGLPRAFEPGSLRRVGEYRGVGIYAAADGPASDGRERPRVVYVPVHPGCEFQPYQSAVDARAVRGG